MRDLLFLLLGMLLVAPALIVLAGPNAFRRRGCGINDLSEWECCGGARKRPPPPPASNPGRRDVRHHLET